MKDLAVIKAAGRQFLVRPGKVIKAGKIIGSKSTIDFIDLISKDKVSATIIKTGSGPKIAVRKFKPKVRHLKRYGHRSEESLIRIDKIGR
jgi:ribosomal protein L21